MKVRELIEILSEQDQNADVVIDYAWESDRSGKIEEESDVELIYNLGFGRFSEIHLATHKGGYVGMEKLYEDKGEQYDEE